MALEGWLKSTCIGRNDSFALLNDEISTFQGDSGSGVYDPVYDDLLAIVSGGPRGCFGPYARYTVIKPYRAWLCSNSAVC